MRALSDLLSDNAVISLDCGANTHFAARCLRLRANQRFTGTGMLATMAPGLPYAIAASLAYPDRQSVAVVGDGGFAMLMAELTTAVANNLAVKIILLKNDSLAEVQFEQHQLGNPEYGCTSGTDRLSWPSPKRAAPTVFAAIAAMRFGLRSRPHSTRHARHCRGGRGCG